MQGLRLDDNNNLNDKLQQCKAVGNLNPNLVGIESDNLYHINLKRKDDNFREQFGDVKVKPHPRMNLTNNNTFCNFAYNLIKVRLHGWHF